MSRQPYLERQRKTEARRQRTNDEKARRRAESDHAEEVICTACGRKVIMKKLQFGPHSDFGFSEACSQSCWEKLRHERIVK